MVQLSGALSVRQRSRRAPWRMCSLVMWSVLTSATSMGFSGTGARSVPDHRFLPPGTRPVKPSPPISGSTSLVISAASEWTGARPT